MTKIQNPKHLFQKCNIHPSKKLGQNFLIDENILKKILEAADLSLKDTVLEIGPGLGILTIELAKKAKKVIAIEKDKKMCDILLEMLDVRNVGNVEVINGDILNAKYELPNTSYKVVANLPYYITSPVIRKFLEYNEARPRCMVLMVQKEVAQRICAKPPPKSPKAIGSELRSSSRTKMNLLAVAVQFYAEPEIISYVSKNSFWPQPKVDSAIIKIKPLNHAELSGTNAEDFFRLVRAGFSSKRKMLKNNLSSTSLGAKKIEKILKKIGLNPKIRAENLSIEDWLKLYEML